MKSFLLGIITISFASIFSSFYSEMGKISTYHSDGLEVNYFSANPPAQRTGAPGESNCSSCHSASVQSAAGTVSFDFSDSLNEYLPGQSYTISLSVASSVKSGFQMTILDGSNNAAGTFTASTHTSLTTAGGRKYIRHSSSIGLTTFSFSWNAPASDLGNLTAYYCFVKANNSGSNSGDEIYLGQEAISISPSAELTNNEELNQALELKVNPLNKQLNLSYITLEPSTVILNLIDFSGKLVYKQELGKMGQGQFSEQIDYSAITKPGVYFVSLLINNYAINQKVFLH